MFSFFKKKINTEEGFYFPVTTDIHSHILPGIDDGSPNVETSLQLVKGLMQLGINKSIATPHIIGDMYRNNADTIFAAQQLLQDALTKEGLAFTLCAAAEYMLDNYFFELLDNKTLMLTVKDNILLTEFSYSAMPSHPEKMSFAIQTEGYIPILAHPERYGYYHRDYKYFNHLKVQKACQYLLFTDLRIKEIADKLGIEDQYYFSRMFAKLMGMSPVAYRTKRIS